MKATAPGGEPFYSVLGNPNFRKLWVGQAISNAGDWFTMLAQLVLVNQITGSALALAGMVITVTLPRLLFSLIAGVFVDRLDRRRLMIVSDLLRMVLVLPMALVQRPDQIWIFYLCGFAMATVGTLFDPAKGAFLPALVSEGELLRANAFSQGTMMLAMLVGPMLAGFVLATTTPGIAFVVDAVSFAVSALAIAAIAVPAAVRPARAAAAGGTGALRGVLAEARAGLRALFGSRTMLAVALVFAVMMLGVGAINVLAVAFLTRNFGVGPAGLGLLDAVQACGMIVGSILAGQWLAGTRPARVIAGGLAVTAGGLIATAWAPSYAFVLGAIAVIGLAMAPVEAVAATLQQTAVPDAERGRVGAGMNTVIVAASLLSMSFAGLAGDAIGVSNVFVVGGLLVLGAAVLAGVLLRPVAAPARPAPATPVGTVQA